MSQTDKVLDYMEQHGSITQKEAYEAFGCFRLGARIADLRDRGVGIEWMLEEGVNRYGEKTRYARYWLKKGA